jgi:hypothetical protein
MIKIKATRRHSGHAVEEAAEEASMDAEEFYDEDVPEMGKELEEI